MKAADETVISAVPRDDSDNGKAVRQHRRAAARTELKAALEALARTARGAHHATSLTGSPAPADSGPTGAGVTGEGGAPADCEEGGGLTTPSGHTAEGGQ